MILSDVWVESYKSNPSNSKSMLFTLLLEYTSSDEKKIKRIIDNVEGFWMEQFNEYELYYHPDIHDAGVDKLEIIKNSMATHMRFYNLMQEK
ncbi:hypothetical protein AB4Z17_29635 [Paenibacillus sp. TAF43_2]|uniref:hypothetical protein n=1 Tax=Paenibacillus sp. TAF43_2 TaxID=3233069 RepID=UPI003F99F909